jgi:hypothetical protein
MPCFLPPRHLVDKMSDKKGPGDYTIFISIINISSRETVNMTKGEAQFITFLGSYRRAAVQG